MTLKDEHNRAFGLPGLMQRLPVKSELVGLIGSAHEINGANDASRIGVMGHMPDACEGAFEHAPGTKW